ncbi:MAG: hypothetical protein SFV51_06470 [Bryobacteraceae bacterium]|nr:hypothetical protein [Bryobacteraceae bacterium]
MERCGHIGEHLIRLAREHAARAYKIEWAIRSAFLFHHQRGDNAHAVEFGAEFFQFVAIGGERRGDGAIEFRQFLGGLERAELRLYAGDGGRVPGRSGGHAEVSQTLSEEIGELVNGDAQAIGGHVEGFAEHQHKLARDALFIAGSVNVPQAFGARVGRAPVVA